MRIALLSTNKIYSAETAAALAESGHIVHPYLAYHQLKKDLGRESYDLLVVDGSPFSAELPRYVQTIIVTATSRMSVMLVNCKDHDALLEGAFILGVDDFIRQQAGVREICARVNAILRRGHPLPYRAAPTLDFPPYAFNQESRTAYLHGEAVNLTNKEFELALFLFMNAGRLLSRSHLLEAIWRRENVSLSRTVDTHVSRIRKRLLIEESNGFRLTSSYGSGYRLEHIAPAEALLPPLSDITNRPKRLPLLPLDYPKPRARPW